MKTLALQIVEEGKVLLRKKVELNHKTVAAPFFCENVSTAEGLGLVCEMGGYSTQEKDTLNFLGATMYNIYNYDTVTSSWRSSVNQATLMGKRVGAEFKQIDEGKLKLIDPNVELYGMSFKQPLYQYMRLKPPTFLLEHMKKLVSKDAKSDQLHEAFWNGLFPSGDTERADAARLIKWSERQERKDGADVYIPTVPSLKAKNCGTLTDKAIAMNNMASDIVNGDVATYFSLCADTFDNRAAIQDILNCIVDSKNRIAVLKFIDPQNFVNISFSEHAQDNLSLFLKTLKLQNQSRDSPMLIGTLNGGGFGYCLLGAGFDFFTDTVGNYAQYPMPKPGPRSLYRQCLSDKRLVLEKYNGIRSKFIEEDQEPLPYLPSQKNKPTKEQFQKNQVNPEEWSKDCKLHGIGMWNEFTKELSEAIQFKTDTLFFDKIQRSAYATLASIINEVRDF